MLDYSFLVHDIFALTEGAVLCGDLSLDPMGSHILGILSSLPVS